ncbi:MULTISPECIES: DUF3466 family protein [unclassified Photobacterium]|uniref:DUF3466 family protein n=1 Tax=unclassified Photobacterium TaxID=2628852 RepID=UPI001EDD797E|nr:MULTISPECIES: DUF3466 family protein [unclassified Photobacterium]MCG3863439.1 DUF3466 family protein [Photobacterium sp. Ph6]MCG3874968.1 DUF3466 family protein [Photobacterium sp. Ph5]
MPHKMLKLSTLAILVAGASQASAAVYTIQPVEQHSSLVDQPYPVQSDRALTYVSTGIESSGSDTSCFETDCSNNSYKTTGQALRGSQGKPINDTVAYNANEQHVNDEGTLWRYCSDNLGYESCEDWAKREFFGVGYTKDDEFNAPGLGGLQKKSAAWVKGYSSNSQGLVDGSPITTFASNLTKYQGTQKDNLGSLVGDGSAADAEKNIDSTVNGVVGDFVYGITSSALFKNSHGNPRAFDKRGFVNAGGNDVSLDPVAKDASPLVSNMGQTQANAGVLFNDQLLVVGSSAYSPSFYGKDGNGNLRQDEEKLPNAKDILNSDNPSLDFNRFKICATDNSTNLYASWECQFSTFANEAAFWLVDANGDIKSGSISSGTGENRDGLAVIDRDNEDVSFQASAKSVALNKATNLPIAAGYSTGVVDNDYYAMQAAYFTADNADLTSWKRTFVPGLPIEPDDREFTYTIANAVNNQSMIVGDAKGNGQKPLRAYVYKIGESSAQFFDKLEPKLFFKNSNSHAAAVNNHDQVVGWVDTTTGINIERKHRAFTYNLLGDQKAWLLDDLINAPKEGNASIANSYRIIDATGINDAGVISANALYCEGGYDNTSQNSYCGGGNVVEKYVAVKLVPINGAKVSDIVERVEQEDEPVKRSGGSLGILALTALGFIGFRRRK